MAQTVEEIKQILLEILASPILTDGAKCAAFAMALTDAETAREVAAVCNKPIRTIERHFTDARMLRKSIRQSAEEDTPIGGGGYAKQRTDETNVAYIEHARDLRNNLKVVSSNEGKKDPPLTPPSPVQTRSWEDDVAAHAVDHDTGVQFDQKTRKVTLVNGTRQLWLDKFGGDAEDLELALIDAAGTVQVNNRTTPVSVQIERRLAIIVRDRREKDKRYAAAVAQNRKADKPKAAFKPSRW